jgi:hypothetical protein
MPEKPPRTASSSSSPRARSRQQGQGARDGRDDTRQQRPTGRGSTRPPRSANQGPERRAGVAPAARDTEQVPAAPRGNELERLRARNAELERQLAQAQRDLALLADFRAAAVQTQSEDDDEHCDALDMLAALVGMTNGAPPQLGHDQLQEYPLPWRAEGNAGAARIADAQGGTVAALNAEELALAQFIARQINTLLGAPAPAQETAEPADRDGNVAEGSRARDPR